MGDKRRARTKLHKAIRSGDDLLMSYPSANREPPERVESFELDGMPAGVETSFVGGLKRLPVRVKMKARAAVAA